MCKDTIINFLLDSVAIPCDVAKGLIDKADLNGDGQITMRELYDQYRRWRDG